MPRFHYLRVLILAAGVMSAPVFAQAALIPPQPVDAVSPPADVAFPTAALDDEALRGIAGREDTSQVSMANLNAGVSQNSVGDNSTTGDARISDNAFQNLSGLAILNVNTGNNVAINAAMNVNISIKPGP